MRFDMSRQGDGNPKQGTGQNDTVFRGGCIFLLMREGGNKSCLVRIQYRLYQ